MVIHIVQPGDTIDTISYQYGVSIKRLVQDNNLTAENTLVPGQTIVILYPLQTYTFQNGDTLFSVAKAFNIPVMQLYQNNPYLSDRDFIYPGETIVISYNNNKGEITINGFANEFIDISILKKTLPYLTYLSIFGYRTNSDAELIGDNDSEIIAIAKKYGVAPIMILSTFTLEGKVDIDTTYNILNNQVLVERHINNILEVLKTKGYYGVLLTFQLLGVINITLYDNYLTKLSSRLKKEGYKVFVSLSQTSIIDINKITFEKKDYTTIGQKADSITFINYNWGYNYGPPLPVSSISNLQDFLEFAITLIPPEKILVGLPTIGYDWELPYEIGFTKATSLSLDSTLTLARTTGSTIQFDEISQTPFFEYQISRSGIPRQHIVWFIDARSIDSLIKLIPEYVILGTGVWNIMFFFAQLWLVINSQYKITKVLPPI